MRHRATLLVVLLFAAAALVGCGSADRVAAPFAAADITADNAEQQFAAAVDLVANLRYREATVRFVRLIAVFEDPAVADRSRAAESTFWLGYCHEKLGDNEKAIAQYRRVLAFYGDLPAARQASQRLHALEDTVGGAVETPAA